MHSTPHTGSLLFEISRSVIERTNGSERKLPMIGMFRRNPLRFGRCGRSEARAKSESACE